MTLDDAIAHCDEIAESNGCEGCARDHRQLSQWLNQLDALAKHILGHHEDRWNGAPESAVECAIRIMGEQAEQIRRLGICLSGLRSAAKAVLEEDYDKGDLVGAAKELRVELDALAHDLEGLKGGAEK